MHCGLEHFPCCWVARSSRCPLMHRVSGHSRFRGFLPRRSDHSTASRNFFEKSFPHHWSTSRRLASTGHLAFQEQFLCRRDLRVYRSTQHGYRAIRKNTTAATLSYLSVRGRTNFGHFPGGCPAIANHWHDTRPGTGVEWPIARIYLYFRV